MGYKLTTIIPVYNGDYIEECLNSLCIEFDNFDNYKNLFEVVIISDGCDSITIDKIENIISKYENIRFYKMEHRGASSARNEGIKHSNGEYICFMDCDDRMCKNFFTDSMALLNQNFDLYIFGIKRFENDEINYWSVVDKVYDNINDFADNYIINRKLLIYSNCNKFYKLNIVKNNNIHFNEDSEFGEDRLFNYHYLRYCNTVLTSSLYKIDYVKRSNISLSTKYQKDFFDIVYKLHIEKIKCFFDLSKNVSIEQKIDFVTYDLTNEINNVIDRFSFNKQEEIENVPKINNLIFEKDDELPNSLDYIVVLGSNNCGYKIEKAYSIGKNYKDCKYIVSGGNLHKNEIDTEAEFMSKYLIDNGVDKNNIYIENKAICTVDNLNFSKDIIDSFMTHNKKVNILLITSAFHLKRTKILSKQIFDSVSYNLFYINSSLPTSSPDNWYNTDKGKTIVLNELKKIIMYNFDDYMKKVYNG